MTRQARPEPLTRDQRRVDDNVRPRDGLTPGPCWLMRKPPVFDAMHNCITCGYRWGGALQTHCHLYETCDRCQDPDNPCDTASQIRADIRRWATPEKAELL